MPELPPAMMNNIFLPLFHSTYPSNRPATTHLLERTSYGSVNLPLRKLPPSTCFLTMFSPFTLSYPSLNKPKWMFLQLVAFSDGSCPPGFQRGCSVLPVKSWKIMGQTPTGVTKQRISPADSLLLMEM